MHSIALPDVAPAPALSIPEPEFEFSEFYVFNSVPTRHDVVALLGMVVVYDTAWREIQDGEFYVTEHQHPVGGMSWEMYDQLNQMDRHLRCRLTTSRTVVRVVRCLRDPSRWWYRLPGGFTDGPLADWGVGHTIVGKVVGIYRPGSCPGRQTA